MVSVIQTCSFPPVEHFWEHLLQSNSILISTTCRGWSQCEENNELFADFKKWNNFQEKIHPPKKTFVLIHCLISFYFIFIFPTQDKTENLCLMLGTWHIRMMDRRYVWAKWKVTYLFISPGLADLLLKHKKGLKHGCVWCCVLTE